MSQRYFLTAESTYEDLRQSLNVALAYPNELGKSVFQTALYAPRDTFRRVLLAVDTDLPGYATINAAIAPLLASDAMEEIDEATYLAALASATGGAANLDASVITTGTLNASRLPSSVVQRVGSANAVSVGPVVISRPWADDPGELIAAFYDDELTFSVYANGEVYFSGGELSSVLAGKADASDFDQGVKTTDEVTFAGLTVDGSVNFTNASVTGVSFDAIVFANVDRILGSVSPGPGGVNIAEEIVCTAAGRAILDDATAADQRTTLSAQKTITSGTAAPTGGSDGDIYLQYT